MSENLIVKLKELNQIADEIINKYKEMVEAQERQLKIIREIAKKAPELNMSNYDDDQVCELNNAMIEIWNILQND